MSVDGYTEELNSPTRGKGSLNKVLENISYLQNASVDFSVMQTLTNLSISHSIDFFNYFYLNGIAAGFFIVKQAKLTDRPSIKQLQKLLDYLYSFFNEDIFSVYETVKFSDNMLFDNTGFPIIHCGAGFDSISIEPSGDVYPCVKLHSDEHKIGNILEDGFICDFNLNKRKILEKESVDKKENCVQCNMKYFCGGGCRADDDWKLKNNVKIDCSMFNFALEYYLNHIEVESYENT